MKQTNLNGFLRPISTPPTSSHTSSFASPGIIPDTPPERCQTANKTVLTGWPAVKLPSSSSAVNIVSPTFMTMRRRKKAYRRDGLNYSLEGQDMPCTKKPVPPPPQPQPVLKPQIPSCPTSNKLEQRPKSVTKRWSEKPAVEVRNSLGEHEKRVLDTVLRDIDPCGPITSAEGSKKTVALATQKPSNCKTTGEEFTDDFEWDAEMLEELERQAFGSVSTAKSTTEPPQADGKAAVSQHDTSWSHFEYNSEVFDELDKMAEVCIDSSPAVCEKPGMDLVQHVRHTLSTVGHLRCAIYAVFRTKSCLLLLLDVRAATEPINSPEHLLALELCGFWQEQIVRPGNLCHVLEPSWVPFDESRFPDITKHVNPGQKVAKEALRISDERGLWVLAPDHLVSGSVTTASQQCPRQEVLKHYFGAAPSQETKVPAIWFASVPPHLANLEEVQVKLGQLAKAKELALRSSKAMLIGNLVHSLFQQLLQEDSITESLAYTKLSELLKSPSILTSLYQMCLQSEDMQKDLEVYIHNIVKWMDNHVLNKHTAKGPSSENLQIVETVAVEDTIWSPLFGLKGRIDVTVRARLSASSAVHLVPVELKSGRTSFAASHLGQVLLYTLLLSCRYEESVDQGLLLYLQTGQSRVVQRKHEFVRGLIQQRNHLAHHLIDFVKPTPAATRDKKSEEKSSESREIEEPPLPPVINDPRTCHMCSQNVVCALYQRRQLKTLPTSHHMHVWIPTALGHLTSEHMNFFLHWSRLLVLEHGPDAWLGLTDTLKGLAKDKYTPNLALQPRVARWLPDKSSDRLICFHYPNLNTKEERLRDVLTDNDFVVVNGCRQSEVALTTGFVVAINDTDNTVDIALDEKRPSQLRAEGLYRIDKYHSHKVMQISLSGITLLMGKSHLCRHLRGLIIDLKLPRFQGTLSKRVVEQVRGTMKLLNMDQRRAVLKVIMAQDYVLIRGYPGTGKTSTIAALIEILVELGNRVLLLSYTHSAVDNVFLKLIKNVPPSSTPAPYLRLGASKSLLQQHPQMVPYTLDSRWSQISSVSQLSQQVDSTRFFACTVLNSHQNPLLSRVAFDVVIVDEAGQVTLPNSLLALYHLKGPMDGFEDGPPVGSVGKFVLVGDSRQLPPLVKNQEASALGLSTSLMQRLEHIGNANATFDLRVQYRMNSTILTLCNHLVYHNAIQCANDCVASATLQLASDCMSGKNGLASRCGLDSDVISDQCLEKLLSPRVEDAVIFLDTRRLAELGDEFRVTRSSLAGRSSVSNKGEAALVARLSLACLQWFDLRGEDIGIVAPYRAQVSLVRHILQQEASKATKPGNGKGTCADAIEVNTVDQYQGRDKRLILITFVRTGTNGVCNNSALQQETASSTPTSGEILHDMARLNVALTRAKHKLVLVGHAEALAQNYLPLRSLVDLLRDKSWIVPL